MGLARWWHARCVCGRRFWPNRDHERCRWVLIWDDMQREDDAMQASEQARNAELIRNGGNI